MDFMIKSDITLSRHAATPLLIATLLFTANSHLECTSRCTSYTQICLKKQILQGVNSLEKMTGPLVSSYLSRVLNSECSRHSPCNESIVDDATCSHCCGHIRHLHACWTLLGKSTMYSQFRSS